MPRMPRRKANARRRRAPAKRKAYARKRNNAGTIYLKRKLVENNLYNTAVAGTIAASSSAVVVGTPYQTPAFAGSNYYNVPFTLDVSLSDLINSTELQAICDMYKINWVSCNIYCTSNTASTGSTAQLPSIIYRLDDDDVVMPAASTAGLNTLRECMSSKVRQFKQNGSPFKIFFKPRIQNIISGAGGASSAANTIRAPFLDTSNPDVPHFGVKGYLQDVNLAATPTAYSQFKFDITMSVTLKGIQ